MPNEYQEEIARLLAATPFGIDPDIQFAGRPPTMANSEFLTNREQGDWAEQVVFNAINEHCPDYRAVRYGRSEDLAAGDEGFPDFYREYQQQLNEVGKLPDLLIFRRSDMPSSLEELLIPDTVGRAVAAIEVRSSSFLANRYAQFMSARSAAAVCACRDLRSKILQPPYSELLRAKRPALLEMIEHATDSTFRELGFQVPSWSSSQELRELSGKLRELKTQMKLLQKRDYLSITPKLEDLALVNRWIQRFGVRHFYLQVFFDKAYVLAFDDILRISSCPDNEDVVYSVERDTKNQQKTTIKVNIQLGKEILGRIEMPAHRSAMKELDRGRLLFYVTFHGGRGYLDHDVFLSEVIRHG